MSFSYKFFKKIVIFQKLAYILNLKPEIRLIFITNSGEAACQQLKSPRENPRASSGKWCDEKAPKVPKYSQGLKKKTYKASQKSLVSYKAYIWKVIL